MAKETIKVASLIGVKANDFMTGTIFELPSGALWRVYYTTGYVAGFRRMTHANNPKLLKAGEERWR